MLHRLLRAGISSTLFLVASMTSGSTVFAQQNAAPVEGRRAPPTVAAVLAVNEAPEIDGNLQDEIWNSAVPVTEFTQTRPFDGSEPTERTEVRIAYNGEAIYIGVRMYDSEPAGVVGRLSRRDTFSPCDAFWVDIDSYHNHRNSFQLGVNPAGPKWGGTC